MKEENDRKKSDEHAHMHIISLESAGHSFVLHGEKNVTFGIEPRSIGENSFFF